MHPRFLRLVAVFLCVIAAPALAVEKSEKVNFAAEARVSDASRMRESWLGIPVHLSPLGETSRVTQESLQLEMTPKAAQGGIILFSFRVLEKRDGRWVAISSGDLQTREGQRTHLLVGGAQASGQIVSLALRASGVSTGGSLSKGSPTSDAEKSSRPRFQRL